MVYKTFAVVCGRCGHRNLPHRSPRKGIALALLGRLSECRGGCGRQLAFVPEDDHRPLVGVVRRQLVSAGFLAADGSVVSPPPAVDPLEVVAFRRPRALVASAPSRAYVDDDFCSGGDVETDDDLDW